MAGDSINRQNSKAIQRRNITNLKKNESRSQPTRDITSRRLFAMDDITNANGYIDQDIQYKQSSKSLQKKRNKIQRTTLLVYWNCSKQD